MCEYVPLDSRGPRGCECLWIHVIETKTKEGRRERQFLLWVGPRASTSSLL